jgi:hypothetical protein
MGFDADLASRALALSQANTDLAAELLLSGDVSQEGVEQLAAETSSQQELPREYSAQLFEAAWSKMESSRGAIRGRLRMVIRPEVGTSVFYALASIWRHSCGMGELQVVIDQLWIQLLGQEERAAVDSLKSQTRNWHSSWR